MKKKIIFFDVDTQFDFMKKKGRLYVEGAEGIIPNLKLLTRLAKKNSIPILSSVDKHKKDDPEFKKFPSHCIEGKDGQRKIPQTCLKDSVYIPDRGISKKRIREALKKPQIVFEKSTFDVFSNPNLKNFLKKIDCVYVYGVALDYCVKAACLGFRKKNINTYLVLDATVAVDKKNVLPTIEALKKKKVNFITTPKLKSRLK